MTLAPGVSFVVPVYNKAPYLPVLLHGLSCQRGDFAREYIFIDDGSTDGSAELLSSRTAKWPEVTLLRQSNQGPSVATNRGIEAARYDMIKFVDADDLLLPDATQFLREALETYPAASMAYGLGQKYQSEAAAFAAVNTPSATPMTRAPSVRVEPALPTLLRHLLLGPSQCLTRTALAQGVGGCDRRIFVQDYSLLLRLAARGPFAAVDAVVTMAPEQAPGRLNDGGPQTAHDLNLALSYFLADHMLAPGVEARAIRRALTRAWLWARRREGAGLFSRWLLIRVLGYLPLASLRRVLLRQSCAAFAGGNVRLMPR
ncbi:MAG: glycosyltransferase family 2 protein [Alphaproteobacteria bacterium]|nr:glycosyltransferase family 2 protein [Alphaproteobacteria bacterium]